MIDPKNITNYYCSDYELEEQIIFWIAAAGKNGRVVAKIVDKFIRELQTIRLDLLPLATIAHFFSDINSVSLMLKDLGCGCYTQKGETIFILAESIYLEEAFDLRDCDPEDLEMIPGIGPKTSRGFIMHTREGARYACLDRHVLRWLREICGLNTPFQTPSNKKYYGDLERVFIQEAEARGMSPTELDLKIWNRYSVKIHRFSTDQELSK